LLSPRFQLWHAQEGAIFTVDLAVREPKAPRSDELGVLQYLKALTFDFDRDGKRVSCVLVYSRPDPEVDGQYLPVVAADTGFEGVACLDDTARAAVLALEVYERTGSRSALALAKRWLTFVEYMQYPDGEFANFIRNTAGVRNATGPTSHKGGYWWSVRALRALARAYRVTGDEGYLQSYRRCVLQPVADGKLQAVIALAELDLYGIQPSDELAASILERCRFIAGPAGNPYFRDQPATAVVSMWGYHQLHAVATGALMLDQPSLLTSCRRTVHNLLEPDIRERFWHSYPDRQRIGVCAYDVAPIVQGLKALHHATGAKNYRSLALDAAEWFYGRNEAGVQMYDPSRGKCRDGITHGVASDNFGAESAIEAGFAELDRRDLLALT
jgi:hypothetical protein